MYSKTLNHSHSHSHGEGDLLWTLTEFILHILSLSYVTALVFVSRFDLSLVLQTCCFMSLLCLYNYHHRACSFPLFFMSRITVCWDSEKYHTEQNTHWDMQSDDFASNSNYTEHTTRRTDLKWKITSDLYRFGLRVRTHITDSKS